MDKADFSEKNRTRLFYLVGDLLEKPLPNNFGGFEGAQDFFVLDELLRRRLGKLQLVPGVQAPESILNFIHVASEQELLDLIELIPSAKLRAGRAFGPVTRGDIETTWSRLNVFLKAIGSAAQFQENGTLNRDGFVAVEPRPLAHLPKKVELERDLRALASQPEPTGVILLDLDGLKAVNEKSGYPAGDKCLEEVTRAVFESIAKKGKLYRFREGDEFAVILRNTTVSETKATAERIREAIESRSPSGDVKGTASIGLASSGQEGLNNADKLLEAAEEALHVSKHTTKNCVTAWPVPSQLLAEVREKRNDAQGR